MINITFYTWCFDMIIIYIANVIVSVINLYDLYHLYHNFISYL